MRGADAVPRVVQETQGLADLDPVSIAAYIEQLQATDAKPTVKQHRAAIRMLLDVLPLNPA